MKRKTRLLDSQSPVEMQKKDLSYNKCNNKISLSSHAELQVYQLQCPHVPLYMYFGIPRKQVLHSRIDTAFSEGVRDMRGQL